MRRLLILTLMIYTLAAATAGAADGDTIVFADVGWDSIRLHNAIAGTIAEAVFDYSWEEISGSTPITSEGVMSGSIDVHMEMWTDNLPSYADDIDQGRLQEVSVNFDDNFQGLYVPRYIIEGDTDRGIEALAPDLKAVADLKDYAGIFADPEDPGKGRIFGGLPGWEVTEIIEKKIEYYALDEFYNYILPGSDAAMSAAIISAWDRGRPIVAYYWEPTWLMGMYDFVLLDDAPFDPDTYQAGETRIPPMRVTICVSNKFAQEHPEFVEFLRNYRTSSALTSEGLAHMQDTGDDYNATARWFLVNHPELVDAWLTPEQADILRSTL